MYANSILGCAPEPLNFKMLFEPFEEQLHQPSFLIEICDIQCRKVFRIRQESELAVIYFYGTVVIGNRFCEIETPDSTRKFEMLFPPPRGLISIKYSFPSGDNFISILGAPLQYPIFSRIIGTTFLILSLTSSGRQEGWWCEISTRYFPSVFLQPAPCISGTFANVKPFPKTHLRNTPRSDQPFRKRCTVSLHRGKTMAF